MATRPPVGSGTRERKRARPVPDTDSLAMDDRGTRPYRNAQSDNPAAPDIPDPENGNHIGDPIKPEETIRATENSTAELPEDEVEAPSDAPTIIRDANQPDPTSRQRH
jgi:hypothetical protein